MFIIVDQFFDAYPFLLRLSSLFMNSHFLEFFIFFLDFFAVIDLRYFYIMFSTKNSHSIISSLTQKNSHLIEIAKRCLLFCARDEMQNKLLFH